LARANAYSPCLFTCPCTCTSAHTHVHAHTRTSTHTCTSTSTHTYAHSKKYKDSSNFNNIIAIPPSYVDNINANLNLSPGIYKTNILLTPFIVLKTKNLDTIPFIGRTKKNLGVINIKNNVIISIQNNQFLSIFLKYRNIIIIFSIFSFFIFLILFFIKILSKNSKLY
jgi:hypothetical protein